MNIFLVTSFKIVSQTGVQTQGGAGYVRDGKDRKYIRASTIQERNTDTVNFATFLCDQLSVLFPRDNRCRIPSYLTVQGNILTRQDWWGLGEGNCWMTGKLCCGETTPFLSRKIPWCRTGWISRRNIPLAKLCVKQAQAAATMPGVPSHLDKFQGWKVAEDDP